MSSFGSTGEGLSGTGTEARGLIQARDWSASPLGPVESWPQALRTLVDVMLGSRQPMFVVWGSERIMLYNDSYAVLLGRKHPRALGRSFADVWTEIIGEVGPILDRAYAGESTHMDDIAFVLHRNGFPEEAHFSFSYTPVHDGSGTVAGMFCACSETTERVFAERRLRETEAELREAYGRLSAEGDRLRELFRQAPGFMFVWRGPEHVYEMANDAYFELVGRRDILGKPAREALPEIVEQGYFDVADRVFATGEPFVGQGLPVRFQRTPGAALEERFVTFIFQPIRGAEGQVTGIFVEGHDVTEGKRAEESLRQAREEAERANIAKSKFLAAASHDLRQPMQSLFLFHDILKPHVAQGGQEALKHLGRGLDAMRELLDSLLNISQLDAGIVQPSLEEFGVHQVIEQIGASYAPVAAAKGLEFRVATCRTVVRSDRTLLGRMVRNLLENAMRYTEAGWIAVECHEAGGYLSIEVHDSGIGIAPEHLERIWEEFHQVGNPERDRNRGLGLGLAIVRRLSCLLDHKVEVRSIPGQGSIFSIAVPCGSAEPQPARTTKGIVAGHGWLALLVDDDPIVLLGLKATFEAWGYEVLAAGSADQALTLLEDCGRRPDVIVADYRLREGRSGTAAILRVRTKYGFEVPGIVLTGETGQEVRDAAAKLSLAIIHKPVTPRQLADALNELFQKS